jgi:hypothetical protein
MERGEGPWPPEEFQRLDRSRQFWGQMGWTLALAAAAFVTLMPVWLLLLPGSFAHTWEAVLLFGAVLSCGIVGSWARSRGRSAVWGLLGLSCFPGLLVVAFLPRRCGWCGRTGARKTTSCASCGGPL